MSAIDRAADLADAAAALAARSDEHAEAGEDAAALALMDQALAADREAANVARESGDPWLIAWAQS